MMLYKNTEVKVCWLDGDTDFFDIVAAKAWTAIDTLFVIWKSDL